MELKKVKVMRSGSYFVIRKGILRKYSPEGILIKNWKVTIRKIHVKKIKKNCEICGTGENLTIDHQPPLSVAPWESKPITKCLICCSNNGDSNVLAVIKTRPPDYFRYI